ncbi:SIS domain-containing protein [Pseudooceanicola nitratireducens]|uniref:SIS domain-containing protein n=1 Tax=Pseudooceanicola nitratireducens TaxID=517719 RepID=UPI003340E9EF
MTGDMVIDDDRTTDAPGALMRREAGEAAGVLLRRMAQVPARDALLGSFGAPRAIYTIARGSSDAACTVFNYEAMAQLGLPSTTLPPSVFSLGGGVELEGALVVALSQSGASADLVASARGAVAGGARVVAITNVDGSEIEAQAHHRIPILAGPERAVPATKSVVGSIAGGLALMSSLSPAFAAAQSAFLADTKAADLGQLDAPGLDQAITGARHIYVIGRQQMLGAAQEIALKIKECCAIHAEGYSASEVLHGPLQLSSPRLLTLILDDGDPRLQDGLDTAQDRFARAGAQVIRLRTGLAKQSARPCGAVLAADMLIALYPQILTAALDLGVDPDSPNLLKKVTQTT